MDKFLFADRFRLLLLGAFISIGLLAAIDIVADFGAGTDPVHILVEIIVFIVSILSALAITLRLLHEARRARELVTTMRRELRRNQAEADQWKSEARSLLQGLGASINRQFDRWKLTPAEKEIALFLLKGLSHREVAVIRGVSEATARQQAGSIYRKADLSGRHDLAAFFLEELALPPTAA